MTAVTKTGGRSPRLRPSTDIPPESLVDVGGKPTASHLLRARRFHGPDTVAHRRNTSTHAAPSAAGAAAMADAYRRP